MKTVQELNNKKVPVVRIDASLAPYRDEAIFTEKLDKANAMLKTARLPRRK